MAAERDPARYHGVGPFDPTSGALIAQPAPPSYTAVFGQALLREADVVVADVDVAAEAAGEKA